MRMPEAINVHRSNVELAVALRLGGTPIERMCLRGLTEEVPVRRLFVSNDTIDLEIGQFSQRRTFTGNIDPRHRSTYVTDRSVDLPVTRWILNTAMHYQVMRSVGVEDHWQDRVEMPMTSEFDLAAIDEMHTMSELFEAVKRGKYRLAYEDPRLQPHEA